MLLVDRLRALYPESSGRARKQWLAAGRVRVNGQVVRRGDVELSAGDRVELSGPTAAFPDSLRLVHEDEDLIVIDKPPGLLSIATPRERHRTAYRMLADYVASGGGVATRGKLTAPGGFSTRGGRIFIVHRLDRETSGLICFAKSVEVKRVLQAQFAARSVRRVYVAVVEGRVAEDEGVLTDRLTEDRFLRVRPTADRRRGKEAITRYRVLERRRHTTLLELTLVTGRRGQIRAQLASAGHPVVGDRDHGSRHDPLRRLCLHATRLGFRHPRGRPVEFESPVPSAFRRA
jgi:23S rRNA pseudouridine1911/1915/1917 synthase